MLHVEFFGKIVSGRKTIVDHAGQGNMSRIQVYAPECERTFTLACPYYLPFENNDSIYAVCGYPHTSSPEVPDKLLVLKHPLVEVSKDMNTTIKFFCGYLKHKAQDFYNGLEQTHHGQDNIFKHVTDIACKYQQNDIFFNPYSAMIDDAMYRNFLSGWYQHKVLRQIFLLGIDREEFGAYKMPPDKDFYTECIANPYKVYTIPLDKADHISNILNRKPSEQDRLCGNVVRKIYDFIKTKGWVGLKYDFACKYFSLTPPVIEKLTKEYDVIVDLGTLYLGYFYHAEKCLAEALTPRHLYDGINLDPLPPGLSPDQEAAIRFVSEEQVSIITGSAGTGKTTIIKTLLEVFTKVGFKVLLVAFPGKAVARIREVTRVGPQDAMTIHRAIAMNQKFDLLIIDEISMVSNDLLYQFFAKYPVRYRIIMVGDPNQLPPIDWGDLTGQLIKSVPHFVLTTQHRQESKDLVDLFGKILARKPLTGEPSENFTLTPGGIETVLEIVRSLKSQGIQPENILVETPLNKDVDTLNPMVQAIFDDGTLCVEDPERHRTIRVGDKMIMTKNNYDVNVMNGDEGRVVDVDPVEKRMCVQFVAGSVWFTLDPSTTVCKNDLSAELVTHSFAITVHKAQGSEWDNVIFYIAGYSQFVSNNIIYTAVSRTKKKLWIVADLGVLNRGILNVLEARLDNLSVRIKDNIKKLPSLLSLSTLTLDSPVNESDDDHRKPEGPE